MLSDELCFSFSILFFLAYINNFVLKMMGYISSTETSSGRKTRCLQRNILLFFFVLKIVYNLCRKNGSIDCIQLFRANASLSEFYSAGKLFETLLSVRNYPRFTIFKNQFRLQRFSKTSKDRGLLFSGMISGRIFLFLIFCIE